MPIDIVSTVPFRNDLGSVYGRQLGFAGWS
jgi:hypothetical protein